MRYGQRTYKQTATTRQLTKGENFTEFSSFFLNKFEYRSLLKTKRNETEMQV